MIRLSRSSRLACIAASLTLGATSAHAQYPTKAPPPAPVKPAAIPAFQEAVLPNGLRILLVESRRQPVVSLALMMNAGDAHDPAGKEGLATLMASLLTKGAGARTADDVSSAIEGVGGSIGAVSGADFLTLRANVLAGDAPLAFELVADAVKRPTFATSEVELARTQTLSALQLELSNPASLAARYFSARLFGAHPYGRRPTTASVRAIAVDDFRAFQKTHLVPRGALLVVAGDITLARVRELAQRQFADWSGAAPTVARRPVPPARTRTEILLVHRPGSVQSNIVVGNLTHAPSSPEYYALSVANQALGGGSDGRLFRILREQKSWTYGAYSSISRNRDIGTWEATAEVRNAVTDSALVELLAQARSLGTTVVAPSELESARGALVGRLPLQLETAQGIAEQVGRYTMLGLPKDFIRTLRPRLASVTGAQIRTAARSYIRPDAALIVVVGDGAQVYEKLAKIAPTRIVSAQGEAMQPSDLVQRTSSLPVDIARIVARTDSFSVLAQGNPFGYQVSTLARSGEEWSYSSRLSITGFVEQAVTVTFGADLAPRRVSGSGKAQGAETSLDVTYAGGRAKGTSRTPTPQGMTSITIDTTVAPGVIDDNMLSALFPGLRWAPGAKFSASVFDARTGSPRQLTLTVTGTESVTVPAGTFDAYRVEQTGGEQAVTSYVTTAAPHRIVKMSLAGAPIEFVLVK